MLDFGRSLEGRIRPIATVTTPLSIVYEGTDDFADSLKELDRYFQIGMHGHFLDRTAPTFQDEFDLLTKVGFKPSIYAGGWWMMNDLIAKHLDRNGFRIDTTMNESGIDSHGTFQLLPLDYKFREIPTWRYFRLPRYNSIPTYPQNLKIRFSSFCVSFHDYDLVNQGLRNWLWIRRMKSVALKSKVTSFEEL